MHTVLACRRAAFNSSNLANLVFRGPDVAPRFPYQNRSPKEETKKKDEMGTTKIAAAPVFFLAVVLLAPLLPLFSSLACVRACVYEYVCV